MDLLKLLLNPGIAQRRLGPFGTGMTKGHVERLRFLLRERATGDDVIRAVYSQDAASLPSTIDLLIKRMPGAVTMPTSEGELREILVLARRELIPVVPRGAGTSGYGGAVPSEGGIVVDLRGLNKLLEINKDEKWIRVQAGAIWWDLEEALVEQGLALCCYPTSAPFATVGGWVAMGGGGVGSFQNGGIQDVFLEARVMTPDGEIRTLDNDLVLQAEGITGFILDVKLRVREKTTILPVAGTFAGIEPVQRLMTELSGHPGVFSVHVLHPGFVAKKQEAAGVRAVLPKDVIVVLVATHQEVGGAKERVKNLVEFLGGKFLEGKGPQWEWDNRFNHVNFKRFGPSLIASEAVVHVARLPQAWRAAEAALTEEQLLWGIATSPDEIDLVGYALADERDGLYPLAAGHSLAFLKAVKNAGGRAYAPGMLLSGEAREILGAEKLRKLKRFIRRNDKWEIMNPGKVFHARVRGSVVVPLPLALGPGESQLRLLRRGYRHKGEEKPDPSTVALATAVGGQISPRLARAHGVFRCSRTGHTNRLGGLHRIPVKHLHLRAMKWGDYAVATRYDTMLPRGMVRAAQEILKGKALPGDDLAAQVYTVPLSLAFNRASQNNTPILEAIIGLREACVRTAGPPDAVQDRIDAAKTGNPTEAADVGAWLPGTPPAGPDTTLVVLGGPGAHANAKAGQAAVNALIAVGVAFRASKKEAGGLGTLMGLGAFDDARTILADMAKNPPGTTFLCLSDLDAFLLDRHAMELLREAEVDGAWHPRATTAVRYLREIKSRLAPKDDAPASSVNYLPGPFETPEDAQAAADVLRALGCQVTVLEPAGVVPDLLTAQLYPEMAQALIQNLALPQGTLVVGGLDTVQALSAAKVEARSVAQVVLERVKPVGGAGPVAAPAEEEEAGIKEFAIPEGAFRVELVKERAVIPVMPDETILDVAEKLGFDLPYSCRAGSCDTCSARYEGQVDQSEGTALKAAEQKTHVLTCIAKPKTDVKIWSDEKP